MILREKAVTATSQELVHRSDIDGLRGVAVLAVLAYHYWGGLFRGGFVGVDIFFVISGYLLSAIIFSEVQGGRFLFYRFYERRIRRIFPALFVLLVLSTGFAVLFLLPPDLESFNHSFVAASLSVSNFHFWKTSNYFDAPAAVRPLLHTWSLGVEEQFYAVLPIFIVLIQRLLPKYMRAIVVFAAIGFFIWSAVEVRRDPGAAFFLPFSRAWELLLGTALALRIFPAPRSKLIQEALAAFGILGILCSVLLLTANTPFPGENVLLPCAGASAIILAANEKKTITGRLLSGRPLVFIGLISYSLYLWHWPLLVFSKIAISKRFDLPHSGSRLLLALLAIAIATVSWRLVETPFRVGAHRPSSKSVFVFGGFCIATSMAIAGLLSLQAIQMGRFPQSVDEISGYLDYGKTHPAEFSRVFGTGSCYLDRREELAHFNEQECLKSTAGKAQVLIFGDSHAANLRSGLESSMPDVNFMEATSSSCPPTVEQNQRSTPECRQFVRKVLNEFIPNRSISTVLLNAFWSDSDLGHLTETIDLLKRRGIKVVVFGPFPVYDTEFPRLLAKAITSQENGFPGKHFVVQERLLDERMSQMAAETWHVSYVSPLKILCPKSSCVEYAAPGVPLEFDESHLTLQGSNLLGRAVSNDFPRLFEQ
jgi:peptidoglycan/LPS O-acetylase OafA/YrhL